MNNGYLVFNSQQTFDNLIDELKENGPQAVETTSRSAGLLKGFKSMYEIQKELANNSRSTEIPGDGEPEEGSEEEYNLAIAEELIKDDVLTYVMDTTLRIGIENKFYKITDVGTFYGPKEAEDQIMEASMNFEPDKMSHVSDDLFKISDNVTFIDTYGLYSQVNYSETAEPEMVDYKADDEEGTESRAIYYNNGSGNTSYYGLATYQWKNNSLWQNFWDKIRGKDVTKENKFNKNLRCQVECFKVNYLFYASSGFKIKCQKRKKILFISYWKSTSADEIVMGIEHLNGRMNFNYNPQSIHYLDVFNVTISSITQEPLTMVYNGMAKIPVLGGWTQQKVTTFFTGMGIRDRILDYLRYPYKYTKLETAAGAWKQDLIIRGLRAMVNKPLKDIGGKITSDEPKVALHFPSYGKMDIFVADGCISYGKGSSKTIRFSQSAGFSFIVGGGLIGYTPEEFDMKNFSMFGAVRVGKVWKGIRFVHK